MHWLLFANAVGILAVLDLGYIQQHLYGIYATAFVCKAITKVVVKALTVPLGFLKFKACAACIADHGERTQVLATVIAAAGSQASAAAPPTNRKADVSFALDRRPSSHATYRAGLSSCDRHGRSAVSSL